MFFLFIMLSSHDQDIQKDKAITTINTEFSSFEILGGERNVLSMQAKQGH